MRSLLDANLLIAILDENHNFHEIAFTWFTHNRADGWASCAITENAVLRVLSNPNYSAEQKFFLPAIAEGLNNLIGGTDHAFWNCEISLTDRKCFLHDQILGPKQLTDIYLLALAVKNGGRLVTFDARVSIFAVKGSAKKDLLIL